MDKDYRFKHTRTGDFKLYYHMVWTTGFNRPILEEEAGSYLLEQIREQSKRFNMEILTLDIVDDNCVDLVASIPSTVAVSQVLKNVKGLSAQFTFKKYPELKKKCYKGKLWNGQSYVETVGAPKKITVKRYRKNQERASEPARDIQTNEILPDWWTNIK